MCSTWASVVTFLGKKLLIVQGPSIKYVTLFLANFDPLPLSHFVTHPGTPKITSYISDPLIFGRPNTKTRKKAPCTNSLSIVCRGFCPGGFVRGSFVCKVFSGVVFVCSPFCHNTSIKTES